MDMEFLDALFLYQTPWYEEMTLCQERGQPESEQPKKWVSGSILRRGTWAFLIKKKINVFTYLERENSVSLFLHRLVPRNVWLTSYFLSSNQHFILKGNILFRGHSVMFQISLLVTFKHLLARPLHLPFLLKNGEGFRQFWFGTFQWLSPLLAVGVPGVAKSDVPSQ